MSYYKLPEEVENHHPAVAGWFLGPVAENFPLLKDIFNSCLEAQKDARQTTYPDDKAFITPAIQSNALFKKQIKDLKDELLVMSRFLADHSVPFWSPRYNGHMNMDSSFPALMGCKLMRCRTCICGGSDEDRSCHDALQPQQRRYGSQSVYHYSRESCW